MKNSIKVCVIHIEILQKIENIYNHIQVWSGKSDTIFKTEKERI